MPTERDDAIQRYIRACEDFGGRQWANVAALLDHVAKWKED